MFARAVGFDRDGAFYPVIVVIVASYYLLFAVMGGSRPALVAEGLGAAVFIVLAVVGFRSSRWIVVAALAGHGLFDLVHASMISDPGVPLWWPAFCSSYDIGLAALVGMRLYRSADRKS